MEIDVEDLGDNYAFEEDWWGEELSDSDGEDRMASEDESQRSSEWKMFMEHLKYFSRRFDRALKNEPQTRRDADENEHRRLMDCISGNLVVKDDQHLSFVRKWMSADYWKLNVGYYSPDDSHFMEKPKCFHQLYNSLFSCSIDIWEDFHYFIDETRQELIDKRKAIAQRKSKHRKRGKKGKGSVKTGGAEKNANCNSTGSVVGETDVHAESRKFDSLGSLGPEDRHLDKYNLDSCEESVFFSFECMTCKDEQPSAFTHQSSLAKEG